MNISDTKKLFNCITYYYITQLGNRYKSDSSCFYNLGVDSYDYDEILKLSLHHANNSESVYLIGFPKYIPIKERPNTLFFFEKLADMLDVRDCESGLIIYLRDVCTYEHEYITNNITTHFHDNFEDFFSITLTLK